MSDITIQLFSLVKMYLLITSPHCVESIYYCHY